MFRRLSTSLPKLVQPRPQLFVLASPQRHVSTYCDQPHPLFNPTEDHLQLRLTVRRFAETAVAAQAAEFDLKGQFNKSLFRQCSDMGLLGVTIPSEEGGAGMDATAATIVHHELSKYDPGFCLAYLAHSMLFVNNFFWSATALQKEKYLAGVLNADLLGGMGMTEPGAGTDAVSGMATTARLEGNNYILNGSKCYITNGFDGDIFLVYAKTGGKISAFLVEDGFAGFSKAKQHTDKCGMRGSVMCELYFDNCKVPVENMLGAEGSGLKHMMRNLEIERLTLAAMSVGIADRCVDIMLRYSHNRRSFGQSINRFGQIQRYVAEGYAMTEAAKALLYSEALHCFPDRPGNRIGTDAAKLFATPVGTKVADWAMQTLGGLGYCREGVVERLWRDAKLLEIGGGTLEAHHKNIIKDLTERELGRDAWKAGDVKPSSK